MVLKKNSKSKRTNKRKHSYKKRRVVRKRRFGSSTEGGEKEEESDATKALKKQIESLQNSTEAVSKAEAEAKAKLTELEEKLKKSIAKDV